LELSEVLEFKKLKILEFSNFSEFRVLKVEEFLFRAFRISINF
jgi:hypothetical protein